MKTKAQISMEYMMIIGFVTLITVPMVIVYYTQTEDITEQMAASQADAILRKVVDSAEMVYYLFNFPALILESKFPAYMDNSVSGYYECNICKNDKDVFRICPKTLCSFFKSHNFPYCLPD